MSRDPARRIRSRFESFVRASLADRFEKELAIALGDVVGGLVAEQ